MNIYYLCATQSSNVGDLLINKMLIDELSQYGNVFIDSYNISEIFKSYIYSTGNVIDVYLKYGFSIKKGNLFSFYRFLKKKNINIFVQSPGPIGKLSNTYEIYFSLLSYLLKRQRIKYYMIGNCCSSSRASGDIVSIRNADSYYVRSFSSVNYLKQNGIDNVKYIPDLAFLYRSFAKKRNVEDTAIFCFREVNGDYSIFISWLKCITKILSQKKFTIKLIYQVQRDKAFMSRISEDLSMYFDVEFHENLIWFDSLGIYSGTSIVISNRLHSLLLGSLHNSIPLAYCEEGVEVMKIKDVYNSVFGNLSEKLMFSSDEIENIDYILSNISSVRKSIIEIVDDNDLLCHDTIKHLFEEYE